MVTGSALCIIAACDNASSSPADAPFVNFHVRSSLALISRANAILRPPTPTETHPQKASQPPATPSQPQPLAARSPCRRGALHQLFTWRGIQARCNTRNALCLIALIPCKVPSENLGPIQHANFENVPTFAAVNYAAPLFCGRLKKRLAFGLKLFLLKWAEQDTSLST